MPIGNQNSITRGGNEGNTAIQISRINSDGTLTNGLVLSMKLTDSGVEFVNPRAGSGSVRVSKIFEYEYIDVGPDLALYLTTTADFSTIEVPNYRPISLEFSYVYTDVLAHTTNLEVDYYTSGYLRSQIGDTLTFVPVNTPVSGIRW